MTKRKWVEQQIGKGILNGMDDACFEFYYKAMHDYNMDFPDADRYAWLNTLFGYDIGADYANRIINWFDNEIFVDVLELESTNYEMVLDACNELGIHLSFKNWAKETPIAMEYVFED